MKKSGILKYQFLQLSYGFILDMAIIFLMSFGIYLISKNLNISLIISAFILLAYGFYVFINRQKLIKKAKNVIHQKNPSLEYSLGLSNITTSNKLQKIQLEHIKSQTIRLDFKTNKWYLLLGLALILIVYKNLPSLKNQVKSSVGNISTINEIKPLKLEIIKTKLLINSPAYTLLPSKTQSDLSCTAYINSKLSITIGLNKSENISVYLNNSLGQKIKMIQTQNEYTSTQTLIKSGIYGYEIVENDSLVYTSPFYTLEAISDKAPLIKPTESNLYKTYTDKDAKILKLTAEISDDFLVKQCLLIVTVARGNGENIKFREEKYPIKTSPFKSKNIRQELDLQKLNFKPGDELYYYWAAIDNMEPEPNFSKSDSYFIIYEDSTTKNIIDNNSMAMNILPEYFRSQRQIIIDTEKLIKAKSKLQKSVFENTSNELGFDQKSLRLRYGQYLGEEFESNIKNESEAESENPLDGFRHDHDSEEQADNHEMEHNHEESKTEDEDPIAAMMEQYVHAHDDAEVNTFYEESTRSLLKMALEQMWQSELHLRLYEPEKALPYENKALEYLKTAQQKARNYAQKTGIQVSPIKEKEKRLKGELDKINKTQRISKRFLENETKLAIMYILDNLENGEEITKNKQRLLSALRLLPENRNLISLAQAVLSKKNDEKKYKDLKTRLMALLNYQKNTNDNSKMKHNEVLKSKFLQNL